MRQTKTRGGLHQRGNSITNGVIPPMRNVSMWQLTNTPPIGPSNANRLGVPCAQCGTMVYRAPSRIRKYKNTFCGNDCANAFKSIPVALTCEVCGHSWTAPSKVAAGNNGQGHKYRTCEKHRGALWAGALREVHRPESSHEERRRASCRDAWKRMPLEYRIAHALRKNLRNGARSRWRSLDDPVDIDLTTYAKGGK